VPGRPLARDDEGSPSRFEKGEHDMARKILACACVLLLVSVALLATGQKEPPAAVAKPKEIKFLSTWNETQRNTKLILDLTAAYRTTHPEFTMNVEVVPSDDLKRQVNIQIASGDSPDIFAYDSGKTLLDLINAGQVVNIEEEFKKLGIMGSLEAGAVSLLKTLVDGKGLYDLPMGWNLEGIWYNKTIFAKYGLKPPTTWAEFTAIAETLKKNGIQPFSAGGKDKWPITRYLNMYVMRKVGVEGRAKARRGQAKFADEGFIEAGQALQAWASQGYFGVGFNTIDQSTATLMFLTGKTAMMYNGSWLVSDLNNKEKNTLGENVGFFSVPLVPGGVGKLDDYSVNCGAIVALSKQKYDAAMADWVKYVFTRIGDKAMSDYGSLMGYTVTVMPTQVPFYTKMLTEEFRKVKTAGLWFEATLDAKTEKVAKDNCQLLFLSEMTPTAYFQSIQESTDEFLKQSK
jgi:raffinose/stachyose/melibiose transport system substrate-binding protein